MGSKSGRLQMESVLCGKLRLQKEVHSMASKGGRGIWMKMLPKNSSKNFLNSILSAPDGHQKPQMATFGQPGWQEEVTKRCLDGAGDAEMR